VEVEVAVDLTEVAVGVAEDLAEDEVAAGTDLYETRCSLNVVCDTLHSLETCTVELFYFQKENRNLLH